MPYNLRLRKYKIIQTIEKKTCPISHSYEVVELDHGWFNASSVLLASWIGAGGRMIKKVAGVGKKKKRKRKGRMWREKSYVPNKIVL